MNKKKEVSLIFPIEIYEILDTNSINSTLSMGRCRIFYKYGNRNGTYITDEFGEKLIKTLPYTPVKGIYDQEKGDFLDHGQSRDEGRIYGVVPNTVNFAWEKHLDDDGTERTYACCDVLLYTGLYSEARQIIGKSLSMEIYKPSVKGHWDYIDNTEYYIFDEGVFLGLQALGNDIEPCFEGAEFFSLYQKLIENFQEINNLKKGGVKEKMQFSFESKENDIYEHIFSFLNPNFTEEGNWLISKGVINLSEDKNSVMVIDYKNNEIEKYSFVEKKEDKQDSTKDEEKDDEEYKKDKEKCSLVKEEQVYHSLFMTESEFSEYNNLKENYRLAEEANKELSTKIAALEQQCKDEKDKYENQKASIASLQAENKELNEYKNNSETKAKKEVLAQYSIKLDTSTIENYESKLSEYDVEGLKKELAYALVQSDPSVLDNSKSYGRLPKDNEPQGGIQDILKRYKK